VYALPTGLLCEWCEDLGLSGGIDDSVFWADDQTNCVTSVCVGLSLADNAQGKPSPKKALQMSDSSEEQTTMQDSASPPCYARWFIRQCKTMEDVFVMIGKSVFSQEMAENVAQIAWMMLIIFTCTVLMTLGVMCAVGLFLGLTA